VLLGPGCRQVGKAGDADAAREPARHDGRREQHHWDEPYCPSPAERGTTAGLAVDDFLIVA
jgi:hypothetical protein